MLIIISEQYLKNDLNGEESSKDMICIAQDLKKQQEVCFFSMLLNNKLQEIFYTIFLSFSHGTNKTQEIQKKEQN